MNATAGIPESSADIMSCRREPQPFARWRSDCETWRYRPSCAQTILRPAGDAYRRIRPRVRPKTLSAEQMAQKQTGFSGCRRFSKNEPSIFTIILYTMKKSGVPAATVWTGAKIVESDAAPRMAQRMTNPRVPRCRLECPRFRDFGDETARKIGPVPYTVEYKDASMACRTRVTTTL